MSDVVIQARNLSKVYRLYAKPHDRFLDMFGLLRDKSRYSEHPALSNVDLDIRRGERVAFIGRNGAGKSTLLKLATRVIEPTSGSIEVLTQANALLQIGAGFHPDFTGRENAYSYLAHLGVTGREADERFLEIVEFAELEEYIDQPIKTYSTGMAARLMFSASTALAPQLLVLDEILSVGDAYFARKSYDRIETLCNAGDTTVLLVSHDVYAASKLCQRMVWIDQGRIMIDGPSPEVMKAYEDSIRVQEEARLRKKKAARLHALAQTGLIESANHTLVELRAAENMPLPCPVLFSRIALRMPNGTEHESPLLSPNGGAEHQAHLLLGEGCWGNVQACGERQVRPMLDHGSPFHKVACVFPMTSGGANETQTPEVLLEYASAKPCTLHVRAYVGARLIEYGTLPPSSGEWVQHVAHATSNDGIASPNAEMETNLGGVYGSGAISVDDIRLVNDSGSEAFHFLHGRAMSVLIDYRVRKPGLKERAQVCLAFKRNGVEDVCRVITRELSFDEERCRLGTIRMHVPRLFLANGKYTASLMIAKEGYYDEEPALFFSISPGVYTCLAQAIEIEVSGGGTIGSGTCVVADAEWNLEERASLPRTREVCSTGKIVH